MRTHMCMHIALGMFGTCRIRCLGGTRTVCLCEGSGRELLAHPAMKYTETACTKKTSLCGMAIYRPMLPTIGHSSSQQLRTSLPAAADKGQMVFGVPVACKYLEWWFVLAACWSSCHAVFMLDQRGFELCSPVPGPGELALRPQEPRWACRARIFRRELHG